MKDQVVWVTGGSAGVGLAVAERFVALGAKVAICARREGPLREAEQRLRGAEGEVLALVGDVMNDDDCLNLHHQIETQLGPIDVLVNNAGAHLRGPFIDHDATAHADMVSVNLRAPVVLTRLVLPNMLERGAGAVVNVASLAGCVPLPGSVTYSATKFGLRAFSRALAEELRGTGVSVSVVSPGPIATDFILQDLDSVTDLTLSQPMSTAEEVAADVVACALDGRLERARPRRGAWLATVGYLAPWAARWLRPRLSRKGARRRRALTAAASK